VVPLEQPRHGSVGRDDPGGCGVGLEGRRAEDGRIEVLQVHLPGRDVEAQGQGPGGDVVEGVVRPGGARLEHGAHEPELGLVGGHDVGECWLELADGLGEVVHLDVVAAQDVDQGVGAAGVLRCPEDVRAHGVTCGLLPRGEVEAALVGGELVRQPLGRAQGGQGGHQLILDGEREADASVAVLLQVAA